NYDHNVKQALKKVSHIPFSSAKFKVRIPKARIDVVEKPIIKKPVVKTEEKVVEKPVVVEKKTPVKKPVIVEKTPVKKEESMLAEHYKNTENDPMGMKKSYFGFKGGFNIATFTGDDVHEDVESETFYNVGMFSITNINQNIAIQFEINYSQKGAYREETDEFGYWQAWTWTYEYVELPLLLKVTLPQGDIYPNIYLGYSLGVLVGAESYWEDEFMDDSADMIDYLNPTDNSFVIGGGVDYILNQKTLIILDMRYTMGLSTWWNEEEYGIEANICNSMFSIMLGVGF
ncbi:MAG: PorT family protein, partial [Candidatus Delongbacteria bacterium]|nr:PorT family protein [Candidatus Delongbacteria bacterium]